LKLHLSHINRFNTNPELMTATETDVPGVRLIEPVRYTDARGSFMEAWQQDRYCEAGLPAGFVQDNLSFSEKGVLRGLHYQHPQAQGKLVSVLRGAVFDVAVDLRPSSSVFEEWTAHRLSRENARQLYVPEGCAHGFLALTGALVHYKCTAPYAPDCERALAWDDPALGIDWPLEAAGGAPVLSEKDAAAPRLADMPDEALPGTERTRSARV
jgi:dTDP-4-dehydrorhamnose 3,5-epimerase